MYASIRKGKIRPDSSTEEVVALIKSGALPILSAIPGFESAYIVRGEDQSFFAMSLFAERGAAEQSNLLIVEWLRQNLGPMLAGPPEALVGEVVAWR